MTKFPQPIKIAFCFLKSLAVPTRARSLAPSSSPNVVTYLATEYAFQGPAQIPAGRGCGSERERV